MEGNWKKKGEKKKSKEVRTVKVLASFPSFPYLSFRKKKKYSPKDAAGKVSRRKRRRGTGREGGMEGEVGSTVVGSRQKI